MDTAQAGADLEEQEDDVFEIVDYTAASTWEKLINALEGAIHSWGLNDGGRGDVDKMEEDGTTARKEVLFLDDVPYVFRYLFLPIEDSDVELKDCEEDETQNDFVPIRLPGFSASTPDNPTTSNPLRHPYHDSEFSTSSLPHALHRYVGLSRILTLTPFDEDSDTPKSPSWGGAPFTLAEVSRTKKLLSSLTIALRNSGCLLPGFVRTGPRWKNLYDGVMISRSSSTSGGESNVGDELDLPRRLSGLRKVIEESPSYRVHFRMGHLSYMPREMDDVRGMVGLFMERLCGVETPYATPDADVGVQNALALPLMTISQCFTYHIPPAAPNTAFFSPQHQEIHLSDPLVYIRVHAYFPVVLPHSEPDSWNNLDLDVSQAIYVNIAPEWRLSKDTSDLDVYAEVLSQLVSALRQPESQEPVGPLATSSSEPSTLVPGSFASATPLSRTQSPSQALTIASAAVSAVVGDPSLSLLDIHDVSHVIARLFDPDTYITSRWSSKPTIPSPVPVLLHPSNTSLPVPPQKLLSRVAATTPIDGLLWQLALRLADATSPGRKLRFQHDVTGFVKAVWREVILEVESCWKENRFIIGVGSGSEQANGFRAPPRIDLRYALVEQKLEMLNCCIYLKRKRGGIRIKRRASKKSRSDVTGDIPGFFAEVGSSRENENSPLPSTGDNYRTLLLGLDGQLPPVIPDIASRAMGRGAEKLRSLLDAGAATSGTALVKLFDRITDDRSVLAGDGSHSSVSQSLSHPVSLMRSSVATGQHGADGWDLDESDLFPTHEVSFAETASTEGKASATWSEDEDEDDDVFFDSVQGPFSPTGEEERPNPWVEESRPVHTSREPISVAGRSTQSDTDTANPTLSNTDVAQSHRSNTSFVDLDPRLPESDSAALALQRQDEEASQEVPEGVRAGHIRRLDMKLLETGEDMWEPEVQDTGFLTDDMLREQEEEWERSAETGERIGSQVRSLESDMSAFKAANPGAVLADFVRWHSPRDWTEGEAGDFELSARMRDSGNLWAETWQQAKRVAAAKQEPLFDYEREAVKALQYLKSITVFELLLQLLPTSFLIVYDHLFTSTSSDITPVRSAHSFFANSLADFPWRSLPCAPGDTELTETASDLLDRLVEESRHAERMVARAASLERVIGPGMPSLIEAALTKEHGEGVRVHDGNERDAVWRMMIDSTTTVPRAPYCREYVIRARVSKPYPWSRPAEQRLYVGVKPGEFRVVETEVEDGVVY